jgi:hypothetical protein
VFRHTICKGGAELTQSERRWKVAVAAAIFGKRFANRPIAGEQPNPSVSHKMLALALEAKATATLRAPVYDDMHLVGSPLITFTTGETGMHSKYPNIRVALLGEDENAFAIVERVQRAMREAGVPTAEVKAFTVEACSGDYYHLLETVLRTVETT